MFNINFQNVILMLFYTFSPLSDLLCTANIITGEGEEMEEEDRKESSAGKTKVMWCQVSKDQAEDSGVHPCGVCRKGVGDNSISCVEVGGISGRLKRNVDFQCRRSMEGNHVQSVWVKEVVIGHNVKLECFLKFCYLGESLGAGGSAEASRARVRCAWAKFKELSIILAARGASYHKMGKIYRTCVHSVLTYGTETWMMKAENPNTAENWHSVHP